MKLSVNSSRCPWLVPLVMLTVSLVPAGLRAEETTKPTEKQRVQKLLENRRQLYANEYDIRALSPRERQAMGVYRFERDLKRLLERTEAGVKLTDLQKRTLRGIVDEQLERLYETKGRPSTSYRKHPNEKGGDLNPGGPEPDKRRGRGIDAGPTPPGPGDRGKPVSTSVYDDPTRLVNTFKDELSAEQAVVYDDIAYRWRVLRPFGVADGPLRQLARAVRDPQLAISDDTRADGVKIIQKQMMDLTRRRARLSLDSRLKAFDEAKAAVVAMMSPEQKSRFEKTIEHLQTVYAREVMMIQDMRAAKKAAKDKAAEDKTAKETSGG